MVGVTCAAGHLRLPGCLQLGRSTQHISMSVPYWYTSKVCGHSRWDTNQSLFAALYSCSAIAAFPLQDSIHTTAQCTHTSIRPNSHACTPTLHSYAHALHMCCRTHQVHHVDGLGTSTRGDALPPLRVSLSGWHCKGVGCQHQALCLHSVGAHPASDMCEVGRRWLHTHQL